MKIQENILFGYYLRETKFCLTAINFTDSKCVNATMGKTRVNASTYNNDKICDRLKQKAVEVKQTRVKLGQRLTHKAATQANTNRGQTTTTRDKLRFKNGEGKYNIEGGPQQANTQGY